jgi:hypothetical protein
MTPWQIEKLRDAQVYLENMPCGAIGAGGASELELSEAERLGVCFYDDATYHQAQRAWLCIESAIPKKRKAKP